jgi:hypothetical protein
MSSLVIYRVGVYIAHLLPVSYSDIIAAVGFGGGLGRHLLFLPALKDEGPCASADLAAFLR